MWVTTRKHPVIYPPFPLFTPPPLGLDAYHDERLGQVASQSAEILHPVPARWRRDGVVSVQAVVEQRAVGVQVLENCVCVALPGSREQDDLEARRDGAEEVSDVRPQVDLGTATLGICIWQGGKGNYQSQVKTLVECHCNLGKVSGPPP